MPKIRKVPESETTYQLQFLCPGCRSLHAINQTWVFNGSYEKPTITPSIKVSGWLNENIPNGICHSFITGGVIQFLGDCTHELKNQTVPLPELMEVVK